MTYALYKTGYFHNTSPVTGQEGIFFSGSGSFLLNSSSITGTSGNAVRLANGGEVRNIGTAGEINGAFEGIRSDGSIYLFNSGDVTGTAFGVVTAGGTVNNSGDGFTTFGHISGGFDGVYSTSFASVGNGYGSIYGGRFGLNLEAGGTINNDIGGISGGTTAIFVTGAPGYVTNAGGITGGVARSGDGIDLLASGQVTNTSHGSIFTTGGRAVYSYAALQSGFVTNYGQINAHGGGAAIGVYLKGNYGLNISGGDVFNEAGGSIYGYVGVSITNGGYVLNGGSITGTGTTGVYIKGSGYLSNEAGGVVTGATYGFKATGNYGRVFNSGSIHGQTAVQINGYDADVANFAGGVIVGYDAGVSLGDGGVVFNGKSAGHTGTISGGYYGVLVQGNSGYVQNQGVIKSFYTAVEMTAGGSVVNAAGALINGYGGFPGRGVLIAGVSAAVNNSGSILGAGYSGVELAASSSASVTNASGGVIKGGLDGVQVDSAFASILNGGSISGDSDGIYLGAGGSVQNNANGKISGGDGIVANAGAAIRNFGRISASSDGVVLASGGTVDNKLGASISGGSIGVLVSGGNATVNNKGSITGGSFAVKFTGGGNDTLVVNPGAVFSGKVGGAAAVSTLVLAAGASAGSISGLGTQFAGFKTIDVNSGSKWTVTGSNSLAAGTSLNVVGSLTDSGTLVAAGPVSVSGSLRAGGSGLVQLQDNLTMASGSTIAANSTARFEIGSKGGTAKGVVTVDVNTKLTGAGRIASGTVDKGNIFAKGGTLTFATTVSGAGTLNLDPHAGVLVNGALSVSKLAFLAGGNETLSLGAPTKVTSTISGFTVASDVIDLKGFVADKLSFAGHTLTVDRAAGTAAHLTFAASYKTSQFHFATDHHGGTNITFV